MAEPCAPISLEQTCCILCGGCDSQPVAQGFDFVYWTSYQRFVIVACSQCGHVFLNPRPQESAASPDLSPQLLYLGGTAHQSILPMARLCQVPGGASASSFFRHLLVEGCHVLEIGCGDCELLLGLKRAFPAVKVTGIDLALPESARKACSSIGINLIESAVENVDLGQETFDLVIMNQVIEHLWDPGLVLAKIQRALRPNGYVSLETPNLSGYDRRLFGRSYWGAYYFPRHLNLFSFATLSEFLQKYGIKIVKQYSLVAPIIWTFSLRGYFAPTQARRRSLAARFFTDRNPVSLAVFSIVDLIALLLGKVTSNQKTIARKVVT